VAGVLPIRYGSGGAFLSTAPSGSTATAQILTMRQFEYNGELCLAFQLTEDQYTFTILKARMELVWDYSKAMKRLDKDMTLLEPESRYAFHCDGTDVIFDV
jgi:hypothetical protein